eukprot:5503897-Amphidinium_carterae.1
MAQTSSSGNLRDRHQFPKQFFTPCRGSDRSHLSEGVRRQSSHPHFVVVGWAIILIKVDEVWLALPGMLKSVFRAELLAVGILEECRPQRAF